MPTVRCDPPQETPLGNSGVRLRMGMGKVTVRLADKYDIPFLQRELDKQAAEKKVERVDLEKTLKGGGAIPIAEHDGKPFCILPFSPVWLAEPHLIFNEEGLSKAHIRRGMLLTFKAGDEFVQQQSFTKTFCHIPDNFPNRGWAQKLGFTYLWDKALTWLSKD